MITYRNDPKFSDRLVWANSADPDLEEQSDQGLHYLLFHLHLLEAFSAVRPICLNFRVITAIFWVSKNLGLLW